MKSLADIFYDGNAGVTIQQTESFSPYLEQGGTCLNAEPYLEQGIQSVNSFCRYEKITAPLLDNEYIEGYQKEKEVVLDVLMHYLILLDMKSGICKKDVLADYIAKELEQGGYGREAEKLFLRLSKEQRGTLCYYMLQQLDTGSSLALFQTVLKSFFEDAAVYKVKGVHKNILIYMGEEQKEELEDMVNGIEELFLPIGYRVRFFWKKHFGVVGSTETMRLGQIEIF